ncbi:succinate dehydrogenase cytochrome b subunit [Flavobacterium silvaticum]|uniref:Succinate dehydrogenase cytochrome b subunit n=1 Tax=Flavobacterium silvaticum TaxID=1852020 RepID=A0A972FTE0_9FLAO|nr:succinate dehydrogenase cytochrome b subunit [Flavobacterium silvaticum]NMH27652.1 succinate dehydrogenase cytochrome b subunit [Flavobacterium silvaticum]
MAKSALLKSSLAKKYWMALTGLFLCLFLVGHLIGNLQILYADPHQFNTYALFMTSNPAIKALSYLTYLSILFHAFDGALLTYRNVKARPVGYVKNNASANSKISSRNMGILGTVILIFIVTHMMSFWAVMHFDNKMPLEKISVKSQMAPAKDYYLTQSPGEYIPVDQVAADKKEAEASRKAFYIKDRTEFIFTGADVKKADGYKDLFKVTVAFFKDPKYGLVYTILYVISMLVLGFHLYHGFASAFQSLGLNHPKYNAAIKAFGIGFSIVVPFLFAVLPVYIHFFLKTI